MKELKEQLNKQVCLALGYFDCLHSVHRKIINSTVEFARVNGIESAVFTFYDEGMSALKNKLIRTYDERVGLIEDLGVDYILPFLFDEKCRKMSKSQFLDKLFSLCDIKAIFCGYDYTFGYMGEGDVEFLKDYCTKKGVEVFVTDKVTLKDEKISSSMIKGLLCLGDMVQANTLLVSPYFIEGEVVHGRGEGKLFGIPTANLKISSEKLLPKNGVYATKTTIDCNTYVSVTNIGGKPTFGIDDITVETLIKGYEGNLYGKKIKVEFFEYIRDVKKFDSPYDLQKQIYSDLRWSE